MKASSGNWFAVRTTVSSPPATPSIRAERAAQRGASWPNTTCWNPAPNATWTRGRPSDPAHAPAALMFRALIGLAACPGDAPAECSETVPCGAFASCVDGQCVAKGCGTSTDCGMQSYCDGGECVAGCQSGDDCYPDEVCDPNTATCAAAACRDTSLDCGFKEFCDPAAGDCYEASGYYCSECRDEDDCGGNGNLCLNFGANGRFCGVTCDTNIDCSSSSSAFPSAMAAGTSSRSSVSPTAGSTSMMHAGRMPRAASSSPASPDRGWFVVRFCGGLP